MSKRKTEKAIIIEVGGDHGDGNVEVVQKPKGITLIIKDWDNATWDGKENSEPFPVIRRFEEDREISQQ